MELTFDWVSYQETFHPRVKGQAAAPKTGGLARPAYLMLEGDTILEAYAEGEDLSEWVGAAYSEVSKGIRNRELIAVDRHQAEQALFSSLAQPHFHQQVDELRKVPRAALSGSEPEVHGHFLMEGLESGWSKVLPSSYGLFIRLEGANGQEKDFVVLVRRGEVVGFHRPDLSFLSTERKRSPNDVVKYLSDKYLVPIQGLFVSQAQWNDWATSEAPWKALALSVRKNDAKLVPWRWSVATWIGAKGLLKL